MRRLSYILFILLFTFQVVDICAENPPKTKKNRIYPKFTRADSLHGALTPFRTCYDEQFIDINLTVNTDKRSIKGCVSTDFIWKENQKTLQIDLASHYKIDSILIDGQRCTIKREYNAVFVTIPHTLTIGQEYRLSCWYGGVPNEAIKPPWEGGFVWKKSASGKPWFGVTCETIGSNVWLPIKDHLSDEPDRGMRLTMTVPKGLVVVSNGVLQSHETIDNQEVWTWQTNYSIDNYNITFDCGDFVHFGEEYSGIEATYPLDYYVLPEDLEQAKISFAQVKDVLKAYEDFYGPYPWAKENFKLIETPFEGMEHQTAIAYGSGFKNTFGFDYIIVHETAHEWWGNSVSADDYAEVFIQEGFAMYSEYLYVERLLGKEKRDTYVKVWANSMNNKRPVVGPRDVNFWDYHDTDPYVKGAWTLHGLRYVMDNDSLFFSLIKKYYQTRKYSIVTVKDFTDFINNETGVDYSWFFHQYLYEAKQPILNYCWVSPDELEYENRKVDYMIDETTQEEELARVSYMYMWWTNVDSSFTMPVSFIMRDSVGGYIPVIMYEGNGLRINKIDKIQVTSNGVVVERYGNHIRPLYFNTALSYYTINSRNKKKL